MLPFPVFCVFVVENMERLRESLIKCADEEGDEECKDDKSEREGEGEVVVLEDCGVENRERTQGE